MKTKIIFGVIFGLLLMAGAFAQDSDLSVSIVPEELSVNPYEIAVYDILVENEGLVDETYTVSVQGIPEDWYSLSHDSIDLASGESKKVYLFVTPQPSKENFYLGEVVINGVSDDFTLTIVKDHSVSLLIPTELTSCICEEDQTMIVVENTGKYSENLALSLSGDALDIIDVEVESFTVEPNESKQIPVTIRAECDTEERNYTLEVNVESTNSYASASASSVITKKKCFDFEVTYPEEVRTCANVEESFKISVFNTGIREDTYEVNIEELGFSDIIDLEPGQVQEFEVTFVKGGEGVYDIPFSVSSERTEEEGLVKFIVEKCYGVDLELDVNEITIQAGTGKLTQPSVKNVGTRADTFEIKSSVAWVAIRPKQVVVLPNKTERVYVYYSPEYGSLGEFNVEISVESDTAFDSETVLVNVEGEEITGATTTVEETPTTILEEQLTTTVEENVTEHEENITTTTETVIIEPPEVNITKPPTGAFGRIWESFSDLSSNLNEKVEELGMNKMVLSLVIGVVIALMILAVIYFIVMSG